MRFTLLAIVAALLAISLPAQEITAPEYALVSGLVHDAHGSPIADATVMIEWEETIVLGIVDESGDLLVRAHREYTPRQFVRTGDDGRFQIPKRVTRPGYGQQIMVIADGYAPMESRNHGLHSEPRIRMDMLVIITGQIEGLERHPHNRVRLEMTGRSRTVAIADDGTFLTDMVQFPNAPPEKEDDPPPPPRQGQMRVMVNDEQFATIDVAFERKPGEVIDLGTIHRGENRPREVVTPTSTSSEEATQ